MAKTTFRFWLRDDKPNKDGSAAIHLIYSIQGQRKYYAIPGVKLFSVNWNADEQQAIYVEKKAARKKLQLMEAEAAKKAARKKSPDIDLNFLLTAAEAAKLNAK